MTTLVGLTLATGVAVAQTDSSAMTIAPYTFVSDAGDTVPAELGRLRVPERHRAPNGRTITLVFVRFPALRRMPGPPIIYLAGGPGGSGIGLARGDRFPTFMALRQSGDVIALDQRGVGMSAPNLTCPNGIALPLNRPLTRAAELRAQRQAAVSCARHWRSRGVELAAYNTNESADDLDALRVALGAEHVVLWGSSYGTHLALAAIRRHPRLASRAILGGIEGPDHTYKLPSSYQRHFDTLAAWAARDSAVQPGVTDLHRALDMVLARLQRRPAKVRIADPDAPNDSDPADSVDLVFGRYDYLHAFGRALKSGGALPTLPTQLAAALRGDFSTAVPWIRYLRRMPDIGSAMSYAMDCASGATSARRRRIEREAARTIFGEVTNPVDLDACDAWGVPDLGDDFRRPVRSAVPLLAISGTLDLNTPRGNASAVLEGFPNGVELVLENVAHGAGLFSASPMIAEVMLAFLNGKPLPTDRITVPFAFIPVPPTP